MSPVTTVYPGCTGCCGGSIATCDACVASPSTWILTTQADYTNSRCGDCAGLDSKTYSLQYQGLCVWQSPPFQLCFGDGGQFYQTAWWLLDGTSIFGFWRLQLASDVNFMPILLNFDMIGVAAYHCLAANTFVNPAWVTWWDGGGGSACTSASSVTLAPA